MSLTRADRKIHHAIKMMIAQHGTDMSPATRAALDNVLDVLDPPRVGLKPLDKSVFIRISTDLRKGLAWRGWTFKDRALMVEMCRQSDHMERRRIARQQDLNRIGQQQ
ncbi:terminase [Corynebacterium phage CL31]|nr:terminase [Corynebacterium phage CL31]